MLPAYSLLITMLLTAACGDVMVYNYTTDSMIIVDEYQDLQASFGGSLPLDGLRGQLVVGDPRDGCSALAPPPAYRASGQWIVLMARYNCSFEVKIRNAQAAGYGCAIVHNIDSLDLETMSAKNSTGIFIPSVFVGGDAGKILPSYASDDYYLVVNGDIPFDINTKLLLPFAIVVALCLVVMVIFLVVKCYNDRRRARRHRLPNRSLKKIPTCKFSKGDPYDMCAICLDEYQEGDKLRVLPCAHAYHAMCIDPWLTQNRRVCPVCKRRVLAAGERRGDDSDDSSQPLVDEPAPTQGGTFEPQRENPFVRAARFMARLRGRRQPPDVEEPLTEDNVPTVSGDQADDDRRPLIQRAATHSGRPGRQRRARRSARSARSASTPRSVGRAPLASSAAAEPLLRSADPSINDARGEIGVAALPASAHSATHVQL